MRHPHSSLLTRRRVFAGAGTVGALAAVSAVLPTLPSPTPSTAQPLAAAELNGGYQLTAHVQRYYQTAKV